MKLLNFLVMLVLFQVCSAGDKYKFPNTKHALRMPRQAPTTVSGALIAAVKTFLTNIQTIIATMQANATFHLQSSINQLNSQIGIIEAEANLSSATQTTCIAGVKSEIAQVRIDTSLNSCLESMNVELTTDLNGLSSQLAVVLTDVDFVVSCVVASSIAGCLLRVIPRIGALVNFSNVAEMQINNLVTIMMSAFNSIFACMQDSTRDSCKLLISLSMDIPKCLRNP